MSKITTLKHCPVYLFNVSFFPIQKSFSRVLAWHKTFVVLWINFKLQNCNICIWVSLWGIFLYIYIQTWANGHLRRATTCLPITTTFLRSHFELLQHKATSEQRPPVNNDHYFGVPRVVVVHKFHCTPILAKKILDLNFDKKNTNSLLTNQ